MPLVRVAVSALLVSGAFAASASAAPLAPGRADLTFAGDAPHWEPQRPGVGNVADPTRGPAALTPARDRGARGRLRRRRRRRRTPPAPGDLGRGRGPGGP